ncbi:MAG: 50S ribosomal protein L5 [Planctomycetes bacterium]|nr:50S ribosomal protein L5 [Planctomycetota bacterium]
MARLLKQYREEIMPQLAQELGRKNPMSLPKIEKICLNMGVGKAIDDNKLLDAALREMKEIAGQAPTVTKARVSVSNFRLREGYRIGCRVTLRGARMYEFLDRMINLAIPAIRDFQGVSTKSFDKQGNYSIGIEEVMIFPEVDADKLDAPLGMDVTIVIKNSQSAEESRNLLRKFGMPFKNQ